MTRIIAGRWGGRQIETPRGQGTRPTSDRVREAMFSSLVSHTPGFTDDLRVLDLFAGSGALGLEALSRGAAHAELVEADARVVAVLKRNVAALGASAQVTKTTAENYVRRKDLPHFTWVFIDPPYAMPTAEVTALVRAISEHSDPTKVPPLFVVERSSRDPFTWPEGVEGLREKKYGETTLWYGR